LLALVFVAHIKPLYLKL